MLQAVQFSVSYLVNMSQPWPTYGTSKDECIFHSPCSVNPWCLCWACQSLSLKKWGGELFDTDTKIWTIKSYLRVVSINKPACTKFPTIIPPISFISLPMLMIWNSCVVSHSNAWNLLASVDVFFLNSDCYTPLINHYILQSVLYLIWTNRFHYYIHYIDKHL